MNKIVSELIQSLIIDIVGMLGDIMTVLGIATVVPSIFLFVSGRAFEVIWSVIGGAWIYKIYGSGFFALADLIEQNIPFADLVPTATLAWADKNYTHLVIKK